MNKLPKVFANTINKELKNNNSVFYSAKEQRESKAVKENQSTKIKGQNINDKINSIFNSKKYVYKAKVIIKLATDEVRKEIIGRNSTHLITIDNEKILISDIIDINYAN